MVPSSARHEDAGSQSEVQLREALHLAKVGCWHWDPQTDTVTWSKELYRISGRDLSLPAVSYRDHVQLYTAESWERLQRVVDEALRAGTPYELDLEMVRPDGTRRWVRAQGEALRDAVGRVTHLRGTAQDITEWKRAEETLRDSEEKFRRVFRDAGVGMVMVSPDGRFLAANTAFCELLGYTEEELTEKTTQAITHPEDWSAFSQKLNESFTSVGRYQRFEKRCLHKSGRTVWTESTASLIRNHSGEPLYFVGEVLDISERKQAEAVLSNVSRRLIEAQEQERTRIARDLHDDINQRLALLAIDLAQIGRDVPQQFREWMGGLSKQLEDIASDVHAMAYRLHSSKLEHLGIIFAIGSFCKEYAEQQKVKIDFSHDEIPLKIPQDVLLCLFRVLQESLSNAVKHSGVRHFEVQLYQGVGEIGLRVSDAGVGFDPETARKQSGLGLVSMRERVRLVRGTLSVESKLHGGTTIHARVPLERNDKASEAAH
jgi:PAS domain S-box-containing protein